MDSFILIEFDLCFYFLLLFKTLDVFARSRTRVLSADRGLLGVTSVKQLLLVPVTIFQGCNTDIKNSVGVNAFFLCLRLCRSPEGTCNQNHYASSDWLQTRGKLNFNLHLLKILTYKSRLQIFAWKISGVGL